MYVRILRDQSTLTLSEFAVGVDVTDDVIFAYIIVNVYVIVVSGTMISPQLVRSTVMMYTLDSVSQRHQLQQWLAPAIYVRGKLGRQWDRDDSRRTDIPLTL